MHSKSNWIYVDVFFKYLTKFQSYSVRYNHGCSKFSLQQIGQKNKSESNSKQAVAFCNCLSSLSVIQALKCWTKGFLVVEWFECTFKHCGYEYELGLPTVPWKTAFVSKYGTIPFFKGQLATLIWTDGHQLMPFCNSDTLHTHHVWEKARKSFVFQWIFWWIRHKSSF